MTGGNIIRPAFAWDAGHFTQMPNTWVRDRRLTRRARGLLLELLSHGSQWQTSIRSLAEGGPEGRDAIQATLLELRGAGYLILQRTKDSHGRYGAADYVLQDPWSGPRPDSPDTGEPDTENPATKKNIPQKNNTQKTAPAAPPALIPADDDVVAEEWRQRREADGHRPGPLSGPARKSIQTLLRDVGADRVLQVVRWLHVDGRWWLDAKRPGVTLGTLRKHWATLDAQVPPDWAPTITPEQAADAAHAAVLEHAGITDAEWARLDQVARQELRWAAEDAARDQALGVPVAAVAGDDDAWDTWASAFDA